MYVLTTYLPKVLYSPAMLLQELENLRDSLEESESSTAAQQEIRAQRENELAQLKKQLEDETANHEATVASMRSKNNKALEDLNEQLESVKKVSGRSCMALAWQTNSLLPLFFSSQSLFFLVQLKHTHTHTHARTHARTHTHTHTHTHSPNSL